VTGSDLRQANPPSGADLAWYQRDRFGLFVSWGISALSNGELSWVRLHERITDDQYEKYFRHFDPDRFDPGAWARAARQAGMKYVVLTTKHHDGFCLWDSRFTEFKATNTQARRDLVGPFVEAFRAEGIRIGFYYSLIDWNHPDFPLDGFHPMRHDPAARDRQALRSMARYAEYMRKQVGELLGNYGRIDLLWFDFSYPNWAAVEATNLDLFENDPTRGEWADAGKGRDQWGSEALFEEARRLQPGIIINDRADLPGDFVTSEQFLPADAPARDGQPIPWEACATMNDAWAYRRDDDRWKPVGQLVQMLIECVSKGGNLLLNVGPTGRGRFPEPSLERLAGVGDWMDAHSRAIYGCGASAFKAPPHGLYTQNGNRLYLHVLAWPFGSTIHLEGLAGKVEYAQQVHDAAEVRMMIGPGQPPDAATQQPPAAGTLTLTLPSKRPDVAVPVIELFLKESTDRPVA
jgi:alpha-L-fucosidase